MSARGAPHGLLIVLEGIDGAGKTGLHRRLAGRLRAAGFPVTLAREPADPEWGRAAQSAGRRSPLDAAICFTVDRAIARPRIDEELARGRIVLQDRSFYSTLAYQASALPPGLRRAVGRWQGAIAREPDRVLWLDLPVSEALERLAHRGGPRAVFERRRTLERVRRAYRKLAHPPRWIRLDASASPEALVEEATRRLDPLLSRWRKRHPRRRTRD